MKSKTPFAVGLLAILVGCTAATSNTTPTPAATVASPTVAVVTGTWTKKVTSVNPANSDSTVTETTLTYSADGTYFSSAVAVKTPTSGSATTTYIQARGTYSFSEDQQTLVQTEKRSGSTPFGDTDTAGNSSPATQVGTAILYKEKLYSSHNQIYKAQGTTSGIVGTWVQSYHSTDESSAPYRKTVLTLNADKTSLSEAYTSTTATLPTSPTSTSTGTYAFSGDSQITATSSGGSTSIFYYGVLGSYLVIAPDDATLGAYTKK